MRINTQCSATTRAVAGAGDVGQTPGDELLEMKGHVGHTRRDMRIRQGATLDLIPCASTRNGVVLLYHLMYHTAMWKIGGRCGVLLT